MNTVYQIISIAFGSGIIGTVLSVYFTRQTSKEENEIKMIDRLAKEIERLDAIVKTLRSSIEILEGDKRDLRSQLDEAEKQLKDARNELNQLKKSMGEEK